MAIEKSLVSGSMTMLILKLLSEKDMYGYEMIDTLRQKSQNVFELKAVFCSSEQCACNGGVIYGRISENITGTDSL